MLKRLLTIGIVLIVGLVLVAADPSGEPDPYAGSGDLETATYTTETESITFIWGRYVGERTIHAQHEAPPADLAFDRETPAEALALLPAHVQSMITGDGLAAYDEDDFVCQRIIVSPYPDRRLNLVNAEGYISCIGSVITHTRLQLELKRVWTRLQYYDSGWRPFLSHGKTIRGRCQSGWAYYTNTLSYQVLFVNGSILRHPPETVGSNIQCP